MRKLTKSQINQAVVKAHKGQVQINWAKTGEYKNNRQKVWAIDKVYGNFQIRLQKLLKGQSPFSSRTTKEEIDKKIKSLYKDKIFIDWTKSLNFQGRLTDKVIAVDKSLCSWETTVRFLFKKVLSKEHYYKRKTSNKEDIEKKLKALNLTIDWNKNKDFKNTKSKVLLKDPEYGEFKVKLYKALMGGKHPQRANYNKSIEKTLPKTEIDKRISSIFKGKVFIDWSKNLKYKEIKDYVIATDIVYGEWRTKVNTLLKGSGHRNRFLVKRKWTKKELDSKIHKIFSGAVKIDWDKTGDYTNVFQKVVANHSKYGEWSIRLGHLLVGSNHPKHFSNFSKGERELSKWIKSLGIKVELNNRFEIEGRVVEADIYIPIKKLAIEFNGLYWHSDLYLDKNYHSNKRELFSKKGIDLIQVWDSEWKKDKNKIKKIILKRLKNSIVKVNDLVNIPRKEAKSFLIKNSPRILSSKGQYLGYRNKKGIVFIIQYEINNKILSVFNYSSKGFLNEVKLLNGAISELKNTKGIKKVILNDDLRFSNCKKLKKAGFILIESKKRRWKTNGKVILTGKKPKSGKILNIFDAGQGKFLKKL